LGGDVKREYGEREGRREGEREGRREGEREGRREGEREGGVRNNFGPGQSVRRKDS
jgi:flagellar biosynthesis/type III secretory pathway protein FliH